MDGAIEFPRDTVRPDRAVAVDEPDGSPHRSAAGPHNRPEWFRLLFNSIRALGRRINTEVKAFRIERRRLGQFLGEVVFRDAAIGRNPEVSAKQGGEGHHCRHPTPSESQARFSS